MSRSSKPDRARSPRFREVRLRGAAAVRSALAPPLDARLPDFVGLKLPAREALERLCVMIVGAGSVGHVVALHLARLRIGEIRIVDHCFYKLESLLTHAALPPSAVGKSKAAWCAKLCKMLSPATRVLALAGKVQSLPLTAFEGVDVVVAATDNLAAEIEVGERCTRHGIALVQGAVYGPMLVAQARYWTNRDAGGPCPACAFTAEEWQHVSSQTFFRCAPVAGADRAVENVAPTMSVSALCGTAADMATMLVLRRALGIGPALDDSAAEYCGYNHRTTASKLVRNNQCPAPHARWETLALDRPAAAWPLRALARAALGGEDLPADLAFSVGDELLFVEKAVCCGWPHEVGRFARDGEILLPCSRCGAPLAPQPFYSHRPVPAAVLGPLLDRPLRRIGAASARALVVHAGARSVLCRKEARTP